MFKSYGKIEVKNGIRIILEADFIRYYKRLLDFYYFHTLKNQPPKHGAHLSIVLPDIHKNIDISKALIYNDTIVDFEYNPEEVIITKKNVWMKANCDFAEKLKKELNVVENDFWGFHIVICNFKFNN